MIVSAAWRMDRCWLAAACNSSSEACSRVSRALVGAGYGQEDLVELALSRALVACLGVLDNEDHGQRKGGYQCLEDGFLPGRESRRDAHQDPRSGRDDDEYRGRWPRRATVDPGQQQADERSRLRYTARRSAVQRQRSRQVKGKRHTSTAWTRHAMHLIRHLPHYPQSVPWPAGP